MIEREDVPEEDREQAASWSPVRAKTLQHCQGTAVTPTSLFPAAPQKAVLKRLPMLLAQALVPGHISQQPRGAQKAWSRGAAILLTRRAGSRRCRVGGDSGPAGSRGRSHTRGAAHPTLCSSHITRAPEKALQEGLPFSI